MFDGPEVQRRITENHDTFTGELLERYQLEVRNHVLAAASRGDRMVICEVPNVPDDIAEAILHGWGFSFRGALTSDGRPVVRLSDETQEQDVKNLIKRNEHGG